MGVPEKNRKERVWYNHLMVISEGIPSIGWIGIVRLHNLNLIAYILKSFKGTKTWPICSSDEGICRVLW